ncbi:rRNA-processing protein bfr2 [Xylographa carneopallida]|nr:rRNA-processing protein bfr2 [Xylographa carneopallida]
MATARPFRTLAEQIAELDDPAPRGQSADIPLPPNSSHGSNQKIGIVDVDPEAFGGPLERRGRGEIDDSEESEEEHENAREHYEEVGESKLRRPEEADLGPRYSGSRVSREDLQNGGKSDDDVFGKGASEEEGGTQNEDRAVGPDEVETDMAIADGEDEDIDSEEAFGEGDEEVFKGFTFRGSGMPRMKALRSGKRGDSKTRAGHDEDEEMSSASDAASDGTDEENTAPQAGRRDGEDASSPDEHEDSMSLDGSASEDDGSASEDDDRSHDSSDASPPTSPASRAALRRMMAASQSTVLATVSLATKADAAKGHAVQHQRSAFDTLLTTRIRLQKALVATNSLAAALPPPTPTAPPPPLASIHAAEAAALALFTRLSSLLHSLHPSLHPSHPAPTRSTPTPAIASTLSALATAARPAHRATLAKWAAKTHLPSATAPRPRLAPTSSTAQQQQQPLLAVLDAHLSAANLPRLLARTRVPRSCAPLQAQAQAQMQAQSNFSSSSVPAADDDSALAAIFDDADFYAVLLRELVERKMSSPITNSSTTGTLATARGGIGGESFDANALTRAAKVRKRVDTKASKGRKMRYAVVERLQNFMPREEGQGWEAGRVAELFGGLLGRRGGGGLGEGEGWEERGSEEGDGAEGGGAEREGLRLFGGV